MENCNGLAVDAETTRVAGFAERLTAVAMLDDRFRGLPRVRFAFTLTVAGYNLVRLPKLLETG